MRVHQRAKPSAQQIRFNAAAQKLVLSPSPTIERAIDAADQMRTHTPTEPMTASIPRTLVARVLPRRSQPLQQCTLRSAHAHCARTAIETQCVDNLVSAHRKYEEEEALARPIVCGFGKCVRDVKTTGMRGMDASATT